MTSHTVQPFELFEPKLDTCRVVVGLGGGPHPEPGHMDPQLHAWDVRLQEAAARRQSTTVRPCLLASLILAAMATAPMGCVAQPGERERYYASHSIVVEARPADHALRLTVWPRTTQERGTIAALDRTTDEAR